jgi:energy-coupling factor transport system ATP-binding protein
VPEPVLRCEGLTYRYPEAEVDALRDVTLRIEHGEMVVLCGLSGSGKTTLMRAASGLVPHFHGGEVSGEISVAGMDVRDHGPAELAAAVGLVAQEPETQVVSTTVGSEIELPLELRGVPPEQRGRTVEEVALALAIADLLERTTDTLSGGELQRVALAAALASRPDLVLLDEPTSQLDPVSGDELIGMLRRLNEEWGVTILLGEHRLERCLGAADRVIAMDGGEIAFDGAPSAFLDWALTASPALATPGARLFSEAGLPPPASVREGRATLARRGARFARPGEEDEPSPEPKRGDEVLRADRLWVELGEGPERIDALRGLELSVRAGERVALMGRNGAGKSTLLRALAGLNEPERGRVRVQRGVALLPQRPGDMLVRETVSEELPGEAGAAALRLFGLEQLAGSDPRDLSGGERQRLALAIVVAGRGPRDEAMPGAVLLDEPTRGMDRARKSELGELVSDLSGRGAAVVIATHDVEFAADFADRVVLMGRGEVVADGRAAELLAGGWYFSTEVARLLSGAAVTPEDGADPLAAALREQGGVGSARGERA